MWLWCEGGTRASKGCIRGLRRGGGGGVLERTAYTCGLNGAAGKKKEVDDEVKDRERMRRELAVNLTVLDTWTLRLGSGGVSPLQQVYITFSSE